MMQERNVNRCACTLPRCDEDESLKATALLRFYFATACQPIETQLNYDGFGVLCLCLSQNTYNPGQLLPRNYANSTASPGALHYAKGLCHQKISAIRMVHDSSRSYKISRHQGGCRNIHMAGPGGALPCNSGLLYGMTQRRNIDPPYPIWNISGARKVF